jgi:hypothetical protein
MKRITLFFALIPFLQLQGEWIQPPEISPKGYLVPSPDYEPSFQRTMEPIANTVWSGGIG